MRMRRGVMDRNTLTMRRMRAMRRSLPAPTTHKNVQLRSASTSCTQIVFHLLLAINHPYLSAINHPYLSAINHPYLSASPRPLRRGCASCASCASCANVST